jgi:HEPN domain-containing protein
MYRTLRRLAASRAPALKREEFQRLAVLRLQEARALLRARHPDGAYYLAGYAVECALKACAARGFLEHDIPKREVVLGLYTHDLRRLLVPAGLEEAFGAAVSADRALERSWRTVTTWSEASRYATWAASQAARLIGAIDNPENGVLPWIERHW